MPYFALGCAAMRVALLSDVHANLAALEAVLADADAENYDAVWHMGDLVGYGPQPDAVIERMVLAGAGCVMGNHDAAAVGAISLEQFNPLAAQAIRWTMGHISDASVEYLSALPEVLSDPVYTRVHGTARNPLWEYLSTFEAAKGHFDALTTPYSIVGHTHLPLVVREVAPGRVDAWTPTDGECVELGEERLCINPGGVGQPRDGDPRSCYAMLDSEAGTVTFKRIEYNIAETQRRMREAGLPRMLVERLALGR